MADRVSSQSKMKTMQFRGKFVKIIVFYFDFELQLTIQHLSKSNHAF